MSSPATAPFQGSLLDGPDEAVPGPLGTTVERIVLSDGAWLDVRRQWMRGADGLFERLLRGVPWRAERRQMYERMVDVPRLLAFYDEAATLPDPALAVAKSALDAHYRDELGEPFAT